MRQQLFFWKTSLFVVLVVSVFCGIIFFQKESNHKERQLFILREPPLVALDQETFQNDLSFQRATVLTSPSLNFESTFRRFSGPVRATAFHDPSQKLILSQGFNLVQISIDQGGDVFYSLRDKIKNPIAAMTAHPLRPNKIMALTENRELYIIHYPFTTPLKVDFVGVMQSLPSQMKIEEMWTNPFTRHLLVTLSSEKDSLLVEMDAEHWNLIHEEMILPKHHLKGGVSLSKQLALVIDDRYQLHVIDTEKKTVIGQFVPNPNFKFADLYRTKPSGMTMLENRLYVTDDYNNLLKLYWEPNPFAIVLNRDLQRKNGKIVLHWKTPKTTEKSLYFAELSLLPKELIEKKKENIPTPTVQTQIPMGPLKKSSLELPPAETAYRSFDVSLFSIHAKHGGMLSPAVIFTIDTERGIQ
ncbi:MAG: hypothetical protein AAB309_05055 [Deltaproteobacteria bacterium]